MEKCIDCGLLAWRDARSGELLEVPIEWRNAGKRFHDVISGYASRILCLAQKETFPGNFPRDSACSEAVSKNRECDSFIAWYQGFTPKEHMEMRLSKDLIESEQKWREAQAEREAQVA